MPSTIKVSSDCFNEIAAALEKQGKKLGQNVGNLTLEKDDELVDPINWKCATVRRDCLVEAVKADPKNAVKLAAKMYEFVTTGKTGNEETSEPKKDWK